MAEIHDLPDELLMHIFSFVGPRAVLERLTRVCKKWHNIVNDPTVWRNRSFFLGDSCGTEILTRLFNWVPDVNGLVIFVEKWDELINLRLNVFAKSQTKVKKLELLVDDCPHEVFKWLERQDKLRSLHLSDESPKLSHILSVVDILVRLMSSLSELDLSDSVVLSACSASKLLAEKVANNALIKNKLEAFHYLPESHFNLMQEGSQAIKELIVANKSSLKKLRIVVHDHEFLWELKKCQNLEELELAFQMPNFPGFSFIPINELRSLAMTVEAHSITYTDLQKLLKMRPKKLATFKVELNAFSCSEEDCCFLVLSQLAEIVKSVEISGRVYKHQELQNMCPCHSD